ncbi:hypothetical protein LTR84_004425 [Exophiala bonariae]|uniref:Uncharacterized protein n=1 Tax=Exophiala bonariae TaxID=1690606 RepID=A0AAV9N835_9EURO|nr:hypothetical protein LTR84_004425 [Exophiala bonariae]
MRLSLNLLFLLFACSCQAGPLVALAVVATEAIAGAAAAASVAGSTIAACFGVTASAIWFGEFVVVNGVLFYGSAVAAGGALAGGIAGGVAGAEVTDKDVEASVMSEYSSALSASMTLQPMGRKTPQYNGANDPFTFTFETETDRTDVSKTSSGKTSSGKTSSGKTSSGKTSSGTTITTSAPPPNAPTANATVDYQHRNGSEIPAGVPEYNFRMCQNDIIAMGQKNISLVFDQPLNQSILVSNIPSTCMVLSTVIAADPVLGPHPVPMGASSLQWNNVDVKAIDLIRQAFGQPPMFQKGK